MSNYNKTIKTTTFEQIKSEEQFQQKLKRMSERPKVSSKEKAEKDMMMAKAAQFVEENIPFDMAPDELKKHHFFKVGYEVAMRRKKALNVQNGKNIGGR